MTKCAQVAGRLVQLAVGRVGRERVERRAERRVLGHVLDDHLRRDQPRAVQAVVAHRVGARLGDPPLPERDRVVDDRRQGGGEQHGLPQTGASRTARPRRPARCRPARRPPTPDDPSGATSTSARTSLRTMSAAPTSRQPRTTDRARSVGSSASAAAAAVNASDSRARRAPMRADLAADDDRLAEHGGGVGVAAGAPGRDAHLDHQLGPHPEQLGPPQHAVGDPAGRQRADVVRPGRGSSAGLIVTLARWRSTRSLSAGPGP